MIKRLTVLTKFIFFMVLLVFLNQALIYAATCTVATGTTHQIIRGFGASNAWSDCGSCTPGSAKNAWFTAANLDMLFNTTGNGIGLSIIRMRIPPDAGQFGAAIAPVQGAAARGAIVMATEWTPPPQWKSANTTSNSNGEYLLPANYQNYANYLRDFVNTMKNTYNVNIYALCGSNEPDYRVSYDGCSWDGTQELNFIRDYLGPTFATANLTTKIIVGESYANNFAITDPTLNDATAANYTAIAAVHTYGGGPTAYPLAVSKGKEYWMTEMANFQAYESDMTGANGGGLLWANRIHTGLVNAEYNAWIYWWLSSDASNEGLCHPTLGNPKRFYTMGNYSKFIRPGYIRIDATAAPAAGITCSAYRDTTSTNFVFLATNTNGSAQSLTYNIPGIGITSVIPYITNSSNNLAAQAAVAVSGNSFTYSLPAQSVVSFVGGMPAGSPTRTPLNTPYAGTPTFTVTPTNTPNSILLDDMEDGNNTNNWGGNWYSYSGTGTTITPKPFTMTAGGMTGSALNRASIIATVADYAGVGTNLDPVETNSVDLTNYTAVEFWVMGNGGTYWFQFTQPSITDGDNFGVSFTAPAIWTKVTVPIDAASLAQRGYGTASTFTKNAISALQWASNANGALDIRIDNVQFLTNNPPTATRTLSRTPGTTFTFTATATRSATPTSTRTAAPASTFTYTRTQTGTFTRTYTPALPTATFTSTAAGTAVFANGADTGWLSQMESTGKIFYNDAGTQQDCLQILKDHCINSIRLRVWVNPAGGWCGQTDVVNMAVRAKNMGFRIMIDFHYSDSWADPGQQTIPVAWAGYTHAQLVTAVYNHTYTVLSALSAAGVTPEWVQVGNETNNGMLWEDGRASVNMANFAQLIASGYDAVKAVFSSAKVIVHISNGFDNALFRWIFDGLKNNGGKWDVIGMSLYPDPATWATLTAQCLTNMNDMIARYPGKEVMISEIGMDFTQATASHEFIVDIINKVKSLPDNKGLGVFYWEPECYNWQGYGKGAFDNTGKPTIAMDAFAENCPFIVTVTASPSAIAQTPSPSSTATAFLSPSYTPTRTRTRTLTPTYTRTQTASPSFTPTSSRTRTPTYTRTVVFSFTSTQTRIVLASATATEINTPSCPMIWSDEFTGPNIDANKWVYETGAGGWGKISP
jgi:arabinogalactan endo-1,4-beta-galactosidase